ncbi:MAG: hypothetical protein ACOY90_04470 [Candidatus Zhuqueibacterota bacterium]
MSLCSQNMAAQAFESLAASIVSYLEVNIQRNTLNIGNGKFPILC